MSGGESRSGTGSGESWFEPRRGNSRPDTAKERCRALCLSTERQLTRRLTVRRMPQLEPSLPAWAIELHHRTERLLIRSHVTQQRGCIPPTAGRRHVLERQVLPFSCPGATEHVPEPSLGLCDLPALKRFL